MNSVQVSKRFPIHSCSVSARFCVSVHFRCCRCRSLCGCGYCRRFLGANTCIVSQVQLFTCLKRGGLIWPRFLISRPGLSWDELHNCSHKWVTVYNVLRFPPVMCRCWNGFCSLLIFSWVTRGTGANGAHSRHRQCLYSGCVRSPVCCLCIYQVRSFNFLSRKKFWWWSELCILEAKVPWDRHGHLFQILSHSNAFPLFPHQSDVNCKKKTQGE